MKSFEKTIVRKIIGPKKVEVTEGRRKKHGDEPRNLHSRRFIRMVKLGGS
jgi:hypothetical protein